MKFFEYILKYMFVLGLTFSMTALLGPKLIKKSLSSIENVAEKVEMDRIEVDYLNENTTRYITAKYTFNNHTYKRIYFTPESEHKMLETFLCKHQLISNASTICKLNESTMPLILTQEQLSRLPDPKVIVGKNNDLQYLKFGDDIVIGKSTGSFGKILLFILGVLFSMFGLLIFIAATAFTLQNLKIYQQTGELPHLPNTIDEMIKGMKFLFGKKTY